MQPSGLSGEPYRRPAPPPRGCPPKAARGDGTLLPCGDLGDLYSSELLTNAAQRQ
jgi:hypothetical protein